MRNKNMWSNVDDWNADGVQKGTNKAKQEMQKEIPFKITNET